MIREEEVIRLGTLRKVYGTRGEIFCAVEASWAEGLVDLDCLVLRMDGILVPFWVKSFRWRQDGLLLTFDENWPEERWRVLYGTEVYMLRKDLPDAVDEDEVEVVGFTVLNEKGRAVGSIAEIDDTTANTLIVLADGTPIPYHEDLLLGIDEENKTIQLIIPEGLIDN